jgi:Cytochrome P450
MIFYKMFRAMEWEKSDGFILADFLLYALALALQGFSLSALGLFVAACWIFSGRQRVPKGIKALPGPWGERGLSLLALVADHSTPGLPFIGRVHDIDLNRSWFKFKEWGDKYGPIYQTTMMGTTHVWISSHEIAVELLAKRGTVYSDRPSIPQLGGAKDEAEYLPFLRYGGASTSPPLLYYHH